jgi:hypothetical protein
VKKEKRGEKVTSCQKLLLLTKDNLSHASQGILDVQGLASSPLSWGIEGSLPAIGIRRSGQEQGRRPKAYQ